MNARTAAKHTAPKSDNEGGKVVKGNDGAASVSPEAQIEEQANEGEQTVEQSEDKETVDEVKEEVEQELSAEEQLSALLVKDVPASLIAQVSSNSQPKVQTPRDKLLSNIWWQMNKMWTDPKKAGTRWFTEHEVDAVVGEGEEPRKDQLVGFHVKLNNVKLQLPGGRETLLVKKDAFPSTMELIVKMINDGKFDDQIERIGAVMASKAETARKTRKANGN